MAVKRAIISFEFESFAGLTFDQSQEHDLSRPDPQVDQSVQPIVRSAFSEIRQCLAASISGSFNFGSTRLMNVNNFAHIGLSVFQSECQHGSGQTGLACLSLMVKFYHLEPSLAYKVAIEIEEMPSSVCSGSSPAAFALGMSNKDVEKFLQLLDTSFGLNGKFESIPILRLCCYDYPRFLLTSDERVIQHDFKELIFHKRSQYQDVKIVSSPSLGNTLLLDHSQNMSEADEPYTFALMDKGKVSYRNKEILILGGGDGGLLYELLKEEPKFVTMVDIDQVVIDACREHLKPFGSALEKLDGPRHKIIIDDCKKVLRQSISSGKKYDVIFNDLTDIPVSVRAESLTGFEPSAHQRDSPWHFIEAIFNLSLECLSRDGLYMSHATGSGNLESIGAYEDFLRNSRTPVEFKSRQSYVPSFMEIWLFYTINKLS